LRRTSSGIRPLIGITSYDEPVAWGAWNVDAVLVPTAYVRAVERAGGRPLVIPPADNGVAETLAVLDGLVFSGGGDVDPDAYGAEPHNETRGVNSKRDEAELALLRAALDWELPLLAVCRGSQVFNVALGGDLVQHLPELVGHDRHLHTPGEFADHDVRVEPATRVGAILGDRSPVKSHHHQAFGRLGGNLREAAWADDGTLEAIEDPTRPFAVGVLWHPEEGQDLALFEALVEEARRYRDDR
jgi:putative glutamine amidotransferase